MMRRALLAGLVALACSTQNREGPDVSCGDLDNGSVNACQQGIIATCRSGKVTFMVCDDDSACDAAWQEKGKYRCQQGDQVPGLDGGASGSGGSGGSGGTGGSSGSGTGGAGGSGGAGASGGAGGGGGSAGSTSCTVCPVGDTGGKNVDAYAVDDAKLYFSDCHTLWSVPKAGGFPTVLTDKLVDCAIDQIELDADSVYLREYAPPATVVRIPKSGGAREVLATATDIGTFTIDAANVYWNETFDIKAVPKSGGATQTVASGISIDGDRMVTQGGYLYWWSYGNSVARVATTGSFPQSPSALALGSHPKDFAVGAAAIYFTVETGGVIGKLPLTGGSPVNLTSGQPSPDKLTLDATSVYWASVGGAPVVKRIDQSGGQPTVVANAITPNIALGRIVVDDAYVYWSEGPKIFRAKK